jgi:hypothetical protein
MGRWGSKRIYSKLSLSEILCQSSPPTSLLPVRESTAGRTGSQATQKHSQIPSLLSLPLLP